MSRARRLAREEALAIEANNQRMQRALDLMNVQFLDDEKMDSSSPLGCSMEDFKRPRPRQCSFGLQAMHFVDRVGGGLDGYNWKIQVPKGGQTYVLKLFWDIEPWVPHYFAAQRECQNAALFQQIKAAMLDAAGAGGGKGPILLNPEPESRRDAVANLLAFSDEARQQNAGDKARDLLQMDEMPRMRKCYGWVKFTGEDLRRHWGPWSVRGRLNPPHIRIDNKINRAIDDEELYTAVVYEFIEEADNDHSAVQSVLDFLWLVGFSFAQSPLAVNWKDGVLIDGSEVAGPRSYGWRKSTYGKRNPESVLRA